MMFGRSECPKCEKRLDKLNFAPTTLNYSPTNSTLRGIIISCPHCGVTISAAIDQAASTADVVAETLRSLGVTKSR